MATRILSALAAASAAELAASLGVESCMVMGKGFNDGQRNSTPNGGIGIIDPGVCQSSCENMVYCEYWTWYNNTGGCWLQGVNSTGDVVGAGVVSGSAACVKAARAANGTAVISMKQAGAEVSKDLALAAAPATEEGGGLPMWGWILASMAGAAAVGGGGYIALGGLEDDMEKKPKKSQGDVKTAKRDAKVTGRDLELADSAQAPLMAQAPGPSVYAAPQYAPAQPMYSSQPMPVAQQMVPMAMPLAYASAPRGFMSSAEPAAVSQAADNLFNQLDTNRNGVLSPVELAAMMPMMR